MCVCVCVCVCFSPIQLSDGGGIIVLAEGGFNEL